ncbi:MAG: DUF1460 domain-containing protein [Elusimicrobia bacterium]|nr:DUF1460 domain-containing protein [Elusimicrobiota bacterium]
MWSALSLTLALAAVAPQGRPFFELSELEIGDELRRIHEEHPDFDERIDQISARFLGTAYRLGPLGEGLTGLFDREPLISFREVDCTTLVEQVMALSLSANLTRAVELLQRIRYLEGDIAYESRNHFPEADWIPNNIKAGFLTDVTRQVAGPSTRMAAKTIRKRSWYESKGISDLQGWPAADEARKPQALERLRSLGARYQDRRYELPYLPIESLERALPRIRSGTIANLVRADRPEIPVLISHQVLLIRRGPSLVVRHAAQGRGVEDVPILDYFGRYKGSKWPLLGLNLNRVRQPPKSKKK